MGAAAVCKPVGQIGTNSDVNLTRFRGFGPSDRSSQYDPLTIQSPSLHQKFDCIQISQFVSSNGRRLFLVDALALVRGLEAQGVPSKQAEAITTTITGVLSDSLENVSQSVVSKAEMQKVSSPVWCICHFNCNNESS